MILWTIQTEAVWRDFQERGVFRGSRERVDPVRESAYEWMVHEMTLRTGPPPTPAAYPVWAWFQWQNSRRAKPDLRSTGQLPHGERDGVRIEFECSDADVLLSDFELWHFVLNGWYLPESEADDDWFEARFPEQRRLPGSAMPAEYHQLIVQSWQKVFDLEWSSDYSAHPKPDKAIQATLWELRADQVREERHFRAR